MPYTTTFRKGDEKEVSQAHDRRDPKAIKGQDHIDPERTKNNITLTDINISDGYHILFDPSLQDYNAKQVEKGRPDRQIVDYRAKVKQDERLNEAYEVILQVGDVKNHPSVETCVEAFTRYHSEWNERNSHFYLAGFYIHLDEGKSAEEFCPHAHAIFIPYSTGNKRGLETQNSQIGALRQMGFVDADEKKHSRTENAVREWTDRERDHFDEICRSLGLEIHHPDSGKGKKEHLKKDMYILTQQKKDLQVEVQEARKEAAESTEKAKKAQSRADKERQRADREAQRGAEEAKKADAIKSRVNSLKHQEEALSTQIRHKKDELSELALKKQEKTYSQELKHWPGIMAYIDFYGSEADKETLKIVKGWFSQQEEAQSREFDENFKANQQSFGRNSYNDDIEY